MTQVFAFAHATQLQRNKTAPGSRTAMPRWCRRRDDDNRDTPDKPCADLRGYKHRSDTHDAPDWRFQPGLTGTSWPAAFSASASPRNYRRRFSRQTFSHRHRDDEHGNRAGFATKAGKYRLNSAATAVNQPAPSGAAG